MVFQVVVAWPFVVFVAVLGVVLAGIYALLLSTAWGRAVCRRRTYWTVVGGHLLMALTMALLSWQVALLFLAWSAVHGLPLVARSLALEWEREERMRRASEAALRGRSRGVNGNGRRRTG